MVFPDRVGCGELGDKTSYLLLVGFLQVVHVVSCLKFPV